MSKKDKAEQKEQKSRKRKKRKPIPIWVKAIICAALTIIGLFLPKAFANSPEFIEKFFTNGLFVGVSQAVGFITSIIPISLIESLIIAAIIAALVLLVLAIIKMSKRKLPLMSVIRFFLAIWLVAAVLLNLFYFMWGFNYYRQPIDKLMELEVKERSVDELYELCVYLKDEAIKLRSQASENDEGIFDIESNYDAFRNVCEGFEQLGKECKLFSRKVYPAKPVMFSKVMSYTGTAGMFIPFTVEANVNVDQPALLIPASAAHENAHFLGIARENEANFVAYLACVNSPDINVKYSGIMLALMNAGNKLYSADSEKYSELYYSYSEDMRKDLANYSDYWKSFEGKVKEVSQKVNDNYLKHNDQTDGIQSYGRVVDLLLAYYAKTQK